MKRFLLPLLLPTAVLTAAAANSDVQEFRELPAHDCVAAPAVPAQAVPRNIILMIGDGMGAEQMSVGWLANRGRLNLEQAAYTGLSRTTSASHTVTDSAAGGTALACGRKTINGHVGQDAEGNRLVSLLREAEFLGKSTGLVVTKDITDATPAAFYAHTDDRRKAAEIATYLTICGAEFVRGGGSRNFTEKELQRMREDGTDIQLTAEKHLPPASERGDVLVQDTREALAALADNEKGFFLMVEGSQIDVACHNNDLREAACEMLDFDMAVGAVLEWMRSHPDTLLVVTADHQTGGLNILDGSKQDGYVKGTFATPSHNGIYVPIYAHGPGAEAFTGIMENTKVFELLHAAMNRGMQPANAN